MHVKIVLLLNIMVSTSEVCFPNSRRTLPDAKRTGSNSFPHQEVVGLFSHAMLPVTLFPDWIPKVKNTAAASGEYLLFFPFFVFLLK
jgi:hypothetical protein